MIFKEAFKILFPLLNNIPERFNLEAINPRNFPCYVYIIFVVSVLMEKICIVVPFRLPCFSPFEPPYISSFSSNSFFLPSNSFKERNSS